MRKEDKLLEKIGRNTGMEVPDGYFEQFSAQMMEKLPAYPEAPRPVTLSTWQRIKPYVYMAAMFAGIWCMMKMFHMASQSASTLQLDNPPESVELAIADGDSYEYFYLPEDDYASDFDVAEDLSASYSNIEDFAKDFDYQLKPEYAAIEVSGEMHT